MKSLIFVPVLLSVILSSSVSAKIIPYFSGQKEYLKQCRTCHSSGSFFVNKYTKDYWKDMMANEGEKLIKIHDKGKGRKIGAVQDYFKSKRYKKKFKYMETFVLRYAKDGNKNPDNR